METPASILLVNFRFHIFGELSEYQYHLIYESQSTQNVMITIQMDKTTTVCVSVFDKVSTILHEKLVVLDLEPKAMVESLQPTQSQNSWRKLSSVSDIKTMNGCSYISCSKCSRKLQRGFYHSRALDAMMREQFV
ncbi:hypothetical protein F2Q70_00039629 [Brassica cretica]|uniref:Uncharacterized protein n=1 Tax=Brassica cretica TaxID=69181 RepID=A0A8S9K5J6_BRACR|nr:hypothetical protein F2Q70_00039629 [Brassica cretica]